MTPNIFVLIVIALLMISILPLIPSGKWWIRVWDFPRIQLAIVAAITGLSIAFWKGTDGALELAGISLCALICVWHAIPVLRYTKLFQSTVPAIDKDDQNTSNLTLLVSNLDVRNKLKPQAAEQIASCGADVVILIEVNDIWLKALHEVREQYPHRLEVIANDGLGLCVWSKISFDESQIRYLVSDARPSIWVRLTLDGLDIPIPVNLVGVHPTPPGLQKDSGGRFNSSIRDAELAIVAQKIASGGHEPWIVSGDFNDVAWSATTRLFERLSGLNDVRVGRGLFNTYHARYPLFRYPIDHVYVSNGFRVASLNRLNIVGSDHFAISARLHIQQVHGVEPDPNDGDFHKVIKQVTDANAELA